ncbi:MAG: oxidoreductase [Burkholderiales bacterium]|nr:MAG: oxidoreductase [Betaproteobacteria bacterium]TAG80861.1 MAG: oxidoreductase [Burkholderiales bacterium]
MLPSFAEHRFRNRPRLLVREPQAKPYDIASPLHAFILTIKRMNATAVVIGATGLTGLELVNQLCNDAHYTAVIAVVRKPYDFKLKRVTTLALDFETWVDAPSALARQLASRLTDASPVHAFCCLGTTIKLARSEAAFRRVDFEYTVAFARAVHELGALHLGVVSALGADARSRVFYSRVKGETEAAIAGVSLPSIHFVRPSFLDGDRKTNRPGERLGVIATKLLSPMLARRLRRYRAVSASRVATALRAKASEAPVGVWVSESETL